MIIVLGSSQTDLDGMEEAGLGGMVCVVVMVVKIGLSAREP